MIKVLAITEGGLVSGGFPAYNYTQYMHHDDYSTTPLPPHTLTPTPPSRRHSLCVGRGQFQRSSQVLWAQRVSQLHLLPSPRPARLHWLWRYLRTRLELHRQHSKAEEQRSHGEIGTDGHGPHNCILVVGGLYMYIIHVGMTTLYQIHCSIYDVCMSGLP